MTLREPLARWTLAIYLLLVLVALAYGVLRLSESTEMPGLAAVELVVLALPWSLALGTGPLARVGLFGMAAVVFAGISLNAFLLTRLAAWLGRRLADRPRKR